MNFPRKAVVLSAGHGTRLMPLTADRPKVMVPVLGRPMLDHHVRWLAGYGVQEIYINLHAHPDAIVSYLGDGSAWGVRVTYSREAVLRGTAGSLNGFATWLDEPFLVHYGDVYSELAVDEMAGLHQRSGALATLAVHPSSHPEDSDIVEVLDDGRIAALHHKPGSDRFGNLGNAGCYLVEPEVLRFLDPHAAEEDFIKDVFPRVLAAGLRLQAFTNRNLVADMGTLPRYRKLEERLAAR